MDRMNTWAPVGLDIDGAKTSDEALKMAGLDWEVNKKPIFNENGKEIPHFFANTRTDNNSVLGVVGDRYKIVQNKDAFDFTNNLIGEGMEFEKAGDWKKGSAIWLEAKLPDTRKILGDDVESHVVFVNSHDGKGSVRVCMLPTRIACANQLNIALKSAERSWSAVHSSKIDQRIKNAQETLGLASKYMDELTKEAETLALQKVSDEQFLKIVNKIYPINENATNAQIAHATEVKNGLMDCLRADDMWDYKGTAYGAVMAVTDYFDHANPIRTTQNYRENNWMKVANGHAVVDRFYNELKALA